MNYAAAPPLLSIYHMFFSPGNARRCLFFPSWNSFLIPDLMKIFHLNRYRSHSIWLQSYYSHSSATWRFVTYLLHRHLTSHLGCWLICNMSEYKCIFIYSAISLSISSKDPFEERTSFPLHYFSVIKASPCHWSNLWSFWGVQISSVSWKHLSSD